MKLILFFILPLGLYSQCPVNLESLPDPNNVTAEEILLLQSGSVIASSHHDDWIVRLELIECIGGERRIKMYTESHLYTHRVPNLFSAQQWMSQQHPSRYYHDEVKPNPELWSMAEEFHQFSKWEKKRCGAFRSSGPQCRRFTYADDARCWQHPRN